MCLLISQSDSIKKHLAQNTHTEIQLFNTREHTKRQKHENTDRL